MPQSRLAASARYLVHRIDQRRDVLRRCVLADAVAEVENVPAAGGRRPEAVQRGAHLGADALRRREQHVRIEIALQRHPVADTRPGRAEVDRPVEPDHVAAAGGDRLQPQAAALGENDARDAETAVLA